MATYPAEPLVRVPADNIWPRAVAVRSPLNFLVSSSRPNSGSLVTSELESGCRTTSKLPVARFMLFSSSISFRYFISLFGFTGLEVRVLDDAQHVAERIDHVRDANALAHVRDLGAWRGAELQQPGVRAVDVVDAPIRT